MFENPITLFLYVFCNLTMALACFCLALLASPKSNVRGRASRLGAQIFFWALGFLLIDLAIVVLFSTDEELAVQTSWHAMLLRVIAAVGVTMFAGGIYVNTQSWTPPGQAMWARYQERREAERARRAQPRAGDVADDEPDQHHTV